MQNNHPIYRLNRLTQVFLISVFVFGCAVIAERQLNEQWGEPSVQDRSVTKLDSSIPEYHADIQPIFDKRCVTCHACYDGPCQLKLSSYEGLDRGASKTLVYDGTRILAADPARLLVDEKNTQGWRAKGYFPVLNERAQIPEANLQGSLLYQMLQQKRANSLPDDDQLEEGFDFSASRAQECPTIEEYPSYAKKHPQWGMPFGLQSISDEDFRTVERWIAAGSPVKAHAPLSPEFQNEILKWERFFNGQTNKERLFSRYAYEHLFLGHLWFEGLGYKQYFRMVRSRTPSGQPVDEIASRRPFDDPKIDQFYYRLRPVYSTIVDKTHMPYRLSDERMAKWKQWFFEPAYEVPELPVYSPEIASNPFKTFRDLPAEARYRFMLEEAEFTIMGYIKGPVCRGQVALNVIEDHFWVFFVDPSVRTMLYDPGADDKRIDHLRLPASDESNALPTDIWTKYSKLQEKHLKEKLNFLKERTEQGAKLSLNLLWDGGGSNQNAALTIFRHFDNATVVKGLQGPKPKTAWVISYSLLERIHYLLVAGFDVYGNIGHQLNTRLYMDFLRMEGESQFLMFMPEQAAEQEFISWYEGAESSVESYLKVLRESNLKLKGIEYKTDQPKAELLDQIAEYLGPKVLPKQPVVKPEFFNKEAGLQDSLDKLAALRGSALALLPELSIVRLNFDDDTQEAFTIAVNRYHKNVSSLLQENKRLKPEAFYLSLYRGILGSYPNTFYDIDADDLGDFVEDLQALQTEEDYADLLDDYGVRRASDELWPYADWLQTWYAENQPLKAGVIDLNRFENR
jgi:Fatty acid cis/trans isomerase (CTI)